MSKVQVLPLEDLTDNTGVFSGFSSTADGEIIDTSDCPFPFFEEKKERYYKIYNDGGHHVATPYFHSYGKRKGQRPLLDVVFDTLYYAAMQEQRKTEKKNGLPRGKIKDDALINYITPILQRRFPNAPYINTGFVRGKIEKKKHMLLLKTESVSQTTALDLAFDSLYTHLLRQGLKDGELFENLKMGLLKHFPDMETIDEYVTEKLEKKSRNSVARKKRFRRKANLNRWNYFVSFTYDDKKHTAESFRKKLRKCLSNLHTRRGWRYMGVFEPAPETGRLHFHGLLYVPSGEMVGMIKEKKDYSTKKGTVQVTHSNDFFASGFGRNDFEELSEMELKHGNTIEYILKYIEKSGERIVYSRGIPTEICMKIADEEIAADMQDFMTKFVLFDDTINFERDIMHYTKWKQMTIIDALCNPYLAA